MPSSPRNKRTELAGLVLLMTLGLSGCGDYLNNWDSSSFRTGDAFHANTSIQETETWPPSAYETTVGRGG